MSFSIRFVAALSTAGLVGCVPYSRTPDTPSVRVLVLNMHAGRDAARNDNLSRVAELVETTHADVVLLQEVDRGTRRSGGVDQPATLARLTGYSAAFGKTLEYDGGSYGLAILARWPIQRDTLVHLPAEPPRGSAGGSPEPRGVLSAVIAAPGGTLAVLNTHLDASGTDTYRRQQASRLLDLVATLRGSYSTILLGGDFNSTPESEVQAELRRGGLRDAWRTCGDGAGLSYPADTPRKRIDYLFLVGSASCERGEVLPSQASDHRGVLFTVRVGAASPVHAAR